MFYSRKWQDLVYSIIIALDHGLHYLYVGQEFKQKVQLIFREAQSRFRCWKLDFWGEWYDSFSHTYLEAPRWTSASSSNTSPFYKVKTSKKRLRKAVSNKPSIDTKRYCFLFPFDIQCYVDNNCNTLPSKYEVWIKNYWSRLNWYFFCSHTLHLTVIEIPIEVRLSQQISNHIHSRWHK